MPLQATISFFGAAGQVTGSCHLLDWAGKKILLDCGMVQGGDQITDLHGPNILVAIRCFI